VGVLADGAGPTVLRRAELDALPVRENTGVDYASTATTKAADGQPIWEYDARTLAAGPFRRSPTGSIRRADPSRSPGTRL
jgi:hypothetical protein